MAQPDVTPKPDFKKLMIAVAMAAFVVNSAWAADLSPRREVTVSGDSVTVGDIFPGAPQHAGYVLAPAPRPGEALTLNTQDLQRVSDTFRLGWRPASGLEQAVVRRSSNEIDRYAVEAAVQDGLAKQLEGRKFEIELSSRSTSFHLPENVPATAEAQNLRYDLAAGTFTVVLVAPAGAATPVVKEEISGRLHALAKVPVLKNPMRQGDVIAAADVEYMDMRADKVSSSIIMDAQKLVGMSPRRAVPAFRPVADAEIVPPLLVKKGDTVLMELNSGSIHLTTQGKALENGAAGAAVRIQNPSSNQVIQAIVTGPKTVSVHAPDGV